MNPIDAEEYTQSLGQIIAGSWRQIALAHRLGVPAALGYKKTDGLRQWVHDRLGGYVKMAVTERKEAVAELAAEDHSIREIAAITGESKSQVARDLVPDGTGDTGNANENPNKNPATVPNGTLDAIPANQKTRLENENKRKAEFAIANELPSGLHEGDFRELSPLVIDDNSTELVFIDPPYDDASIPLYEAAAQEAARILKPGGSLISYCGHLQLPHVLPLMSSYLKYYWMGAHVHDGGPMSRVLQYGIVAGFKPLLWFVKEYRVNKQSFLRDTVLVKREKDVHPWQQAEATAEHFIAGLTLPNGLVVDFFAGGGTTAAVAKRLGRSWITFEIEHASIYKLAERLS